MRKQSWEILARIRADKRTARAEKRRRLIREAHPTLDPRALSNLQAGHTSEGVRAARAYIKAVAAMLSVASSH
jgi:hypothetical protein